ncbi:MAG: bi-domain-containing oxidoreductase [Ignavibacteria bacterium]|nr:bi-domain-containing oxidoreductase [Ignavibacteria bacterium]
MEQLTQQLKSGVMEILDVPFPGMNENQILVRNYYSVISAGTEGKTVSDARKGYLAKAKSRQKEVKQVLEMVKSEGLVKTYDLVMNKLETPAPLGYSCSGEVIAVGKNINDIRVGDRVACGGSGAYHSEIVSVYRNLCVKVPESVQMDEAAFATIGSIAIQGIRQADMRFGENCVVIGLGLIGLLTIKLLNAAGIKAIGVDISPSAVVKAKKEGAFEAFERSFPGLENAVIDLTDGVGTDAVIITAGSSSLDPVEFAGSIARHKGKVVIVGAVPTGFSRSNYYKKELDLRMSSSYGPGRYDPLYEEKGFDYPIGYVRFTENRNMKTFIDFLNSGKISIQSLISHKFSLENSPEAYDLVVSRKEPVTGILIEYDIERTILKEDKFVDKIIRKLGKVNASFIGAGNFAQNEILPRIKDDCNFIGIVTGEGNSSSYVANKYGFKYATDEYNRILTDPDTNLVFVVTRHDSHAKYVAEALKHDKNVFVEKPLALNFRELEMVKQAHASSKGSVLLGFNRRFSPLTEYISNNTTPSQLKSINIRVNAGIVPPDHWVHDPAVGGGRILGEVCHFVDLACFLSGSTVKFVSASIMDDKNANNDTVVVNLKFSNGSIASVTYFSNGNKNVPKERIEVFTNGAVFIINDFKELELFGDTSRTIKLKSQDKGHTNQFKKFIKSLKEGTNPLISFDEIYHSTAVTLSVLDSIRENRTIEL